VLPGCGLDHNFSIKFSLQCTWPSSCPTKYAYEERENGQIFSWRSLLSHEDIAPSHLRRTNAMRFVAGFRQSFEERLPSCPSFALPRRSAQDTPHIIGPATFPYSSSWDTDHTFILRNVKPHNLVIITTRIIFFGV
jgi:hypothetical protein